MTLLEVFIVVHVALILAIWWGELPPLWHCHAEGRTRHFFAASAFVMLVSLVPVYNLYVYLTTDASYFYYSPYDNYESEKDGD